MSNFLETLPQEIVDMFSQIGLLIMLFAGCLVFLFCFAFYLVNVFYDRVERKADLKHYLQRHRFDRFRVKPFLKNEFIIVEHYGVNCPPFDVIHCKHFENADKICQILNCDFLDERYTEKKFLQLSTCSNAEDINHFKDPQNEGERS